MAGNYPKRAPKIDQIIAAIADSGGIKSSIASRLKVHRGTVELYLKRWPSVRQAYDQEIERLGDTAESVIHEAINDRDLETAKWYARVKLGSRGYSERSEVKHSGDADSPIVIRAVGSQALQAAETAYLARIGIAAPIESNGHASEPVSGQSTDLVVRVRDDHSPHNGATEI